MENKDFIEDSELRIAICDDDKSDREKVHVLLQDYLKKKSIKAQVKVFDHPDTLIEECEHYSPHIYILDIESDKSVCIKIKGGIQTLHLCDILYIEYRNHVVSYHMDNGEIISTPTLRIGFAEYLSENHPGKDFVRCHESIAVNIAAIDKLTKIDITLRGGEQIPVTKSRYSEVMDSYMDYRL